jgi:hypothetical protein
VLVIAALVPLLLMPLLGAGVGSSPSIKVPASARAGQVISVRGTDFAGGSMLLLVWIGTTEGRRLTVGPGGTFESTVMVPEPDRDRAD